MGFRTACKSRGNRQRGPPPARRTGDTGACIAGDFLVAGTSLHSGDLPRARRHFDSAIASYRGVDAAAAHRLAYEYSIELGAFSYASWCWWLLGYPDQALGF